MRPFAISGSGLWFNNSSILLAIFRSGVDDLIINASVGQYPVWDDLMIDAPVWQYIMSYSEFLKTRYYVV